MNPGARESDALLVAMYEGVEYDSVIDPHLVRRAIRARPLRAVREGWIEWATDLGFGALVTGDYGEADR